MSLMSEQQFNDLYGAITDLAQTMGVRFDGVEGRLDRLETRVTSVEGELRGFKVEVRDGFARVTERLDFLEARER